MYASAKTLLYRGKDYVRLSRFPWVLWGAGLILVITGLIFIILSVIFLVDDNSNYIWQIITGILFLIAGILLILIPKFELIVIKKPIDTIEIIRKNLLCGKTNNSYALSNVRSVLVYKRGLKNNIQDSIYYRVALQFKDNRADHIFDRSRNYQQAMKRVQFMKEGIGVSQDESISIVDESERR